MYVYRFQDTKDWRLAVTAFRAYADNRYTLAEVVRFDPALAARLREEAAEAERLAYEIDKVTPSWEKPHVF